MHSTQLNEHDANQGAQSSGEFLGMTGNSGWYLLGSGGVTIMMVIVLWGILGVSLLLCLFVGLVLCLGSVAYVFALKNNKPDHYDTDFLESALVESGVMLFRFGPRETRLANPFTYAGGDEPTTSAQPAAKPKTPARVASPARSGRRSAHHKPAPGDASVAAEKKSEPASASAEVEHLQERLSATEEQLEDALAEGAEV